MPEIVEPQVVYLRERARDYRVVAVLVAGRETPDRARCDTVLAMDPEIDSAVAVFPFGGLSDRETFDVALASNILTTIAPEYSRREFTLRCTRILDLVLVKVLIRRT